MKKKAAHVNWCSLKERNETQNRLHTFGRKRPTAASVNTSPRCRRELNHYPRANLTHHQRIDVHAVEKKTHLGPAFRSNVWKNSQCTDTACSISRGHHALTLYKITSNQMTPVCGSIQSPPQGPTAMPIPQRTTLWARRTMHHQATDADETTNTPPDNHTSRMLFSQERRTKETTSGPHSGREKKCLFTTEGTQPVHSSHGWKRL